MRPSHACALVIVACLTSACGARTPRYGIYFGDDGSGTDVDMKSVRPDHIDRAFEAAAQLLGMDPHDTAEHGFVLEFHQGAIAWENSLYSGTTQETTSRVVWYPCAFQPESAMVHEFVHAVLFARRADADLGHTNPAWQRADGARAELEKLCP